MQISNYKERDVSQVTSPVKEHNCIMNFGGSSKVMGRIDWYINNPLR